MSTEAEFIKILEEAETPVFVPILKVIIPTKGFNKEDSLIISSDSFIDRGVFK